MQQQRQYPRYEVKAYADYTGSDILLYHGIQNLSLGGICLHVPARERVGARVAVVLSFPELERELAMTGEVVWAKPESPHDLGIRWVNVTSEQRQLLSMYLNASVAGADVHIALPE